MPDMLVRLYDLPAIPKPKSEDTVIRRALAPEKHHILDWVGKHFSAYWVSECDVAINRQPVTCFIATQADKLVGFACYDVTKKGFFGPTGVDKTTRGQGLGKILLLQCLHDMWAQGYGYAIIGGVGPVEFYAKAVGATLIDNSTPGVYSGLLRDKE